MRNYHQAQWVLCEMIEGSIEPLTAVGALTSSFARHIMVLATEPGRALGICAAYLH